MLHSTDSLAPSRDAASPGMLHRLLAAEGESAHRDTVLALLQANGFDAMSYGRLRPLPGMAWSWRDVASYGDAAALSCEPEAAQRDPRISLALCSCLPVFWTLDELLRSASAEGRQLVQHTVAALGFQSGATLALAGPGPGERSVVHLLSRRAHSGRDIDDAQFGRVLVLGLGVHDYHARRPQVEAAPIAAMPRLTATQREVLRCLASGLADKQIADRLALSLHTVDYHMRQLRKRFGARNRLHLTQLWESRI